jgi:anti-anti-sigma factor
MTDPLALLEVAEGPGGGRLLTVRGEIDTSNAAQLQRDIIAEVRPGRLTVLDLGAVTYIDSPGVRLIVAVALHVRADGGELVIVAPEGSFAAELLGFVQLDDVVRTVSSPDEAADPA